MALTVATQLEIDGPRNVVAKTTGDLLSTDFGAGTPTFTILNPAALTDMNPGMSGAHLATRLRINCLQYSLSDGMTMQLYWNATTPVLIAELYGRGKVEAKWFGGLQNNAGAGVDGSITAILVLSGEAAIATVAYTFLLVTEAVKYRPISVGGA